MCDLWYEIEKRYKAKIKKHGYIIHVKIDDIKDLEWLKKIMEDRYKDLRYTDVVIQMRVGEEDEKD